MSSYGLQGHIAITSGDKSMTRRLFLSRVAPRCPFDRVTEGDSSDTYRCIVARFGNSAPCFVPPSGAVFRLTCAFAQDRPAGPRPAVLIRLVMYHARIVIYGHSSHNFAGHVP